MFAYMNKHLTKEKVSSMLFTLNYFSWGKGGLVVCGLSCFYRGILTLEQLVWLRTHSVPKPTRLVASGIFISFKFLWTAGYGSFHQSLSLWGWLFLWPFNGFHHQSTSDSISSQVYKKLSWSYNFTLNLCPGCSLWSCFPYPSHDMGKTPQVHLSHTHRCCQTVILQTCLASVCLNNINRS